MHKKKDLLSLDSREGFLEEVTLALRPEDEQDAVRLRE